MSRFALARAGAASGILSSASDALPEGGARGRPAALRGIRELLDKTLRPVRVRIALFRASRVATVHHLEIMRRFFPDHDWSKANPVWVFLTATRGRDRLTELTIRAHNVLERRHHGPSRTLANLREKIFDVTFARLEHMRDPLMTNPRSTVAALRRELVDGTMVPTFLGPREIHPSLCCRYAEVEEFVRATCEEALDAAAKIESLLRARSPFPDRRRPALRSSPQPAPAGASASGRAHRLDFTTAA